MVLAIDATGTYRARLGVPQFSSSTCAAQRLQVGGVSWPGAVSSRMDSRHTGFPLLLEFSQDSRGTAAMTDEQQEPVVVPHRELDRATLQAVIESFALREGTDYGEREYSLQQKVTSILRQLDSGEARLVFDPNSQTVDIQSTGARSSRG